MAILTLPYTGRRDFALSLAVAQYHRQRGDMVMYRLAVRGLRFSRLDRYPETTAGFLTLASMGI